MCVDMYINHAYRQLARDKEREKERKEKIASTRA